MAAGDVVTILVEYCEDGEDGFRSRHGPEAAAVVRDVMALLKGELGGQLDYDTLWAEFEVAPRETAPELTGALEALVEADPGLSEKMKALMAEYYSAIRPKAEAEGPVLEEETPEAEESEFIPRREARVEEHEAEPLGHADNAGEGTYLYGNVRAGGEPTLEETLEVGPDVSEGRREPEILSLDIRALFGQLANTVEEEEALGEDARQELRDELELLEAQLMLGEGADEEQLVKHLRRLGEIDLDFLELVLSSLRRTRNEVQAVLEHAIERMSKA